MDFSTACQKAGNRSGPLGDEEGWREGEVSAESIGKMAFPGVALARDSKPSLASRLKRGWTETGLQPCRGRPSGLYVQLEALTQN
jgi:hypothetical protein